jgi:Protein of unknown function (DUF2917)
MDTGLIQALTKLGKGELLRIHDGQGKGIAVFQGDVWITQEGDLRDVVLGAGDSFALDKPGLALVQALSDTRVLVFDANPAAARTGGTDSISVGDELRF